MLRSGRRGTRVLRGARVGRRDATGWVASCLGGLYKSFNHRRPYVVKSQPSSSKERETGDQSPRGGLLTLTGEIAGFSILTVGPMGWAPLVSEVLRTW